MKKIFKISIMFLALFAVASCDNTLDINVDPSYPTSSTADLSLASGEVFITSAIGGDLQLMGSIWSQYYAQHTGSNQYTGIDSYNIPNSSSYTTRTWSLFYAGALPDLENAIAQSAKDKEWSLWFMSQTLKAFSFHVLVDFYGEVPFTDALKGIGVNPKYNTGREVNAGIITILDQALAKATDAKKANDLLLSARTKSDLLLDCDIDTWIQFAKTLKLKVMLRDYTANKTAINALLAEGDLLTTDVAFAKFEDKENASNPLYENDRRKLNTQNNLRASSTLAIFLNANKDPRKDIFFEKSSLYQQEDIPVDTIVGLPQGGYTLGANPWTQLTSRARLAATDPVYFMSAAESHFLQAECLVLDGKIAEAKAQYDLGVTAAFNRWELSAATFIAAGGKYEFNVTSSTTMLQSIWRQKWIAAVRSQAWDSFFEINRTGYPAYGTQRSTVAGYVVGALAPSINSVLPTGEFPRRLIYPKTSVDYNPNAPVTIPLQTKMWWHK
jgi:hypothetical protein